MCKSKWEVAKYQLATNQSAIFFQKAGFGVEEIEICLNQLAFGKANIGLSKEQITIATDRIALRLKQVAIRSYIVVFCFKKGSLRQQNTAKYDAFPGTTIPFPTESTSQWT